jgi:N-6 DNA Methylase
VKLTKLQEKVAQIIAPRPSERDIYPYLRDLLTRVVFGVDLHETQVNVDSPIPGVRDTPDLAVFLLGQSGKPLRTPDHCVAVFEVKTGDQLASKEAEILEEKRKYVQIGTRFFYLVDQVRVIRYVVPGFTDRREYLWSEMAEQAKFQECMSPISAGAATVEAMLRDFRAIGAPFADIPINEDKRRQFIFTIRTAVQLVVGAVGEAVTAHVIPALKKAHSEIAQVEAVWEAADIAFSDGGLAIEFARGHSPDLSPDVVREYLAAKADLLASIDDVAFALRVEYDLLPGYAARMGVDGKVSLLSPRKQNGKLTPSGWAIENFVYETSSLIISRMLMIRFSEDNGLLSRMISNGGVKAFGAYADHFSIGMQALVKEAYRHARTFYTNLFSTGPLDWILDREDPAVSDTILHAMFLLNRWNFADLKGDILAGVYDQYLEPARRRELGEVFTRPEIADYVLGRCISTPTDTVFDPACGSGTFLVQRLSHEIERLKAAGSFNLEAVTTVLGRIAGLDINPFSVTLAQMQLLWHLIELLRPASQNAEARTAARRLMAAIRVEGGHTSLETFGTGANAGTQSQLDFDAFVATEAGRRRLQVSATQRFKAVVTGRYDAVVGNPPYVRAHRLTMPDHIAADYSEVHTGQVDLYVSFVYRALKWWVKPGGCLGFIVPITVLTADYAAPLRRLVEDFRILEIVDLECLRKLTFRGVKRQTVALIIQNVPPGQDDNVRITTLSRQCYDPEVDLVRMELADVATVRRVDMMSAAYHTSLVSAAELEEA